MDKLIILYCSKFEVFKFVYVFEKSLLCSLMLLFDQKYNKRIIVWNIKF